MATVNFLYRSTKDESTLNVRLLYRLNSPEYAEGFKDFVLGSKTLLMKKETKGAERIALSNMWWKLRMYSGVRRVASNYQEIKAEKEAAKAGKVAEKAEKELRKATQAAWQSSHLSFLWPMPQRTPSPS